MGVSGQKPSFPELSRPPLESGKAFGEAQSPLGMSGTDDAKVQTVHFIVLHFTALKRYCVFLQNEGL